MAVEMREGVWKSRGGQTVTVCRDQSDCAWDFSDRNHRYDDGRWMISEGIESQYDLVEYVGPLPLMTKPGVYRRIDNVLVNVRRHDDLDLWVGDDGYHRDDDGRLPYATAIGRGDLVEYIGPLPEEPVAEAQATADSSDEVNNRLTMQVSTLQNRDADNELKKLQNACDGLNDDLSAVRYDRDRLQARLTERESKILVLEQRLEATIALSDGLQSQLAESRKQLQDRDADDQVPGTDWKVEAEAQNAINELLRRDVDNLRDIQIKTSLKVSDMTQQNQGLQRRNQDLVLEISRLKEDHAKQIANWQASSEAMSSQIADWQVSSEVMSSQIVALQTDNIMLRAKPVGTVGDQEDVAELAKQVDELREKFTALKLENTGLKQRVSNQAETNRQLSDELDATKVKVGKLRKTISELETTEHDLVQEVKKITEQLEQAKAQIESQKLNSDSANNIFSMWQQRAQQLEKDLQAERQNHRATEIRLDEVRRLLLFLVQNVHCHNNDPTEDAQ